MRRALTALARVLLGVLVVLLATTASAVAHLGTPLGRRAVADVANVVLRGLFRGTLRVGAIEALALLSPQGALRARGVTLDDADGVRIAEGALEVAPLAALWPALRGRPGAAMPEVHLELSRLLLRPTRAAQRGAPQTSPWVPSIAEAFLPRAAAPEAPPSAARRPAARDLWFRSLRLRVARVESELGAFPAEARGGRVDAELHTEPLRLGLRPLGLELHAGTYPAVGLEGELDLSRAAAPWGHGVEQALLLRAEATLRAEGAECHVRFVREETGPEQAVVRVTLEGCRVPRRTLEAFAPAAAPLPDVTLDDVALTLEPQSPVRFHARGAVGGAQLDVQASASTQGDPEQHLDLTVRGAVLEQLRPGLPAGRVDGTVRFTRRGASLVLDASELSAIVADVPLPSFVARASLRGTRLTLDELTSPNLSILASGSADVADPLGRDAALRLQLRADEISKLPFVRRRASGAASLVLEASRRDGTLEASAHLRGSGLRVGPGLASSASVRGTVRVPRAGAMRLEADIDLAGVALPRANAGPLTLRGRVEGDPTRALSGNFDAQGTLAALTPPPGPPVREGGAPVPARPASASVRGGFRVTLGPQATVVRLERAHARVQGAEGTLDGELRLPRGGGALAARVALDTRGAGSVRLRLDGTEVAGTVRGFDAGWLARLTGRAPWLTGRVDGDVALLMNATGRAGGTLTWEGGRLPGVGGFDLRLQTRAHRGATELLLDGAFGDDRARRSGDERQVLSGFARYVPPRSAGDLRGWLRGLRDVQLGLRNVDLGALSSFLPEGARLAGRGEVSVRAERAEPGAPLDAIASVDVREVVPSIDAAGAAPVSLRSLLRRNIPPRPLTVPLRLRAAVCARLADDALRAIDLRSALALGRESSEPYAPPPAECSDNAVSIAAPLLRGRTRTQGPWRPALARALRELAGGRSFAEALREGRLSPATREELRASSLDGELVVGPLDARGWPFAPAAAIVSPALRSMPVPGTLELRAGLDGSLGHPLVTVRGTLDIDDLPVLVARDALHVAARAAVEPLSEYALLAGPLRMEAQADAHLLAHTAQGLAPAGNARAEYRARGELRRLLAPEGPGVPLTIERLSLESDSFQLGRLAWARAHGVDGTLALQARETGDPFTPASVAATVTDLRVRNQRHTSGMVGAFVRNNGGSWEVQSCAVLVPGAQPPAACNPDDELAAADDGGLRAVLTLPFIGSIARATPDPEGVHVAVSARRFRLESISPLVESSTVLRVGGALSTERLAWSASSPRSPAGHVLLDDGLLEVARIGQPARRIVLDVDARARRLQVNRLALALGSLNTMGTLEARGEVDLREADRAVPDTLAELPRRCTARLPSARGAAHRANDRLARVRLEGRATRLPALLEGRTFAVLSAALAYNGEFYRSGLRGEVSLDDMGVNIPDEPSRDLQETDAHGAVFVLGENRAGYSAPSQPYPIDLDYCTQNPFWARRSDLDIAVTTAGRMHYDRAGLALTGSVELTSQQSYFDLFGRRFFFDRINLRFDGQTTIDPALDIQARYDSAGTGRIRVTVTGRLHGPEINFVSERYPEASQSDVIALLLLGRRDSRGAGEQTQVDNATQQASIQLLTGVLLGFASDYIRNATREGQLPFVARPILEPGANGRLGRYGAGLTFADYNRLYIEGTYGTPTGSGSSNAGAALGQEGRLFIEWAATDHFSLGATFGLGSSAGGTATSRTALDAFFTP